MQPTNHHLSVTLPDGKTARGRVVYVQPKEARWREQTAVVHIVCSEWLDSYWYPAIYSTGEGSFSGQYMPHLYELGDERGYLFRGTFERAQTP